MKKKTRIKLTKTPPTVLKQKLSSNENKSFIVDHYSYSSFVKITSNPIMFKINNINGDVIDTTSSTSNLLGRSVHKGLQRYLGGNPNMPTSADEGEAIKEGYQEGLEYLQAFSDGLVSWNDKIPNKTKLEEKYSQCYFGYIKEFPKKDIKEIVMVEKMIKHTVEIEGKRLPVPLKGSADLVYVDQKDRLVIWDHKIVGIFSKDDEFDGPKLVQAAFNYFLVYAETGIKPYKIVFGEYKSTENRDKSDQMKPYELVYDKFPLMFDLFYRLYEDITQCLIGNHVFLPNLTAMYDKEVSIMAYIHRLDDENFQRDQFAKSKVENITEFLKKKIEKAGAMKKYLENVSKNFISSTTLNYKDMTTEDKIKMKLAEHGLSVNFIDKIVGHSVEMYRYEPSIGLKMSKIEAYVKDIEQVVEISGIRVLAPIAGTAYVGFEVPLKQRMFPEGLPEGDGFNVAIGVDIMGKVVRMDIREAPHMIIAGSTGSGKSVFMATLIKQLAQVKDVEMKFFDPKMVELSRFEDIGDYSDDYMEISVKLAELVIEMQKRQKKLKTAGVRNIQDFKKKSKAHMPYIFVFIDEYADLVMTNPDVKIPVILLAQKARAMGIHLIITTQRPSVKILSGEIKSNFPCRVAFRTSTGVDSQVIIDQYGAEKLLGKGDLLLLTSTIQGITRLQSFNE